MYLQRHTDRHWPFVFVAWAALHTLAFTIQERGSIAIVMLCRPSGEHGVRWGSENSSSQSLFPLDWPIADHPIGLISAFMIAAEPSPRIRFARLMQAVLRLHSLALGLVGLMFSATGNLWAGQWSGGGSVGLTGAHRFDYFASRSRTANSECVFGCDTDHWNPFDNIVLIVTIAVSLCFLWPWRIAAAAFTLKPRTTASARYYFI